MIAHLIERVSSKDVISFFFCRFDDQESLKATTIFGSIVKQMVKDLPADAFNDFNHATFDEVAIIEFLEAKLHCNRQYFIVLDGLDECAEAQVKQVAETFHRLLQSSRLLIKLFWSSRPNVLNSLSNRLLSQQRIDLEDVENQSRVANDIHKLIQITLEEWLEGETPELKINDPCLIITIRDHLEKGAQGMYAIHILNNNNNLTLKGFCGSNFNCERYVEKNQIVSFKPL